MRGIQQILQESHRIIEFNNQPGLLTEKIINENKFLSIIKGKNGNRDYSGTVILNEMDFIGAIEKNSSDVIILNSTGIAELKGLQNTHNAMYFLEKITLLSLPLVIYYFVKGILSKRQKYYGLFDFRKGNKVYYYLGIIRTKNVRRRTRHYLSPLIRIEDFFQSLNENDIQYCILRWFEDLPEVGINEDIDLLVDDRDLDKLHQFIDSRPGIAPFDIYSKTGKPGSDFQGLPYYVIALADKALSETILYKNTFKVPTWENYFYLLAYHVVFHKGEEAGLSSKVYNLTLNNKPDHNYVHHLKLIAKKAQLQINEFSLEGLHKLLEAKGYAPPLDTQYKLSLKNQYLKTCLEDIHEQSEQLSKFEGLICFVAREKVIENGLLDELKMYIQKEGFTILRIKKLEEPFKIKFVNKVRGGNWNQGPWPVSGGLPAVLLVALDVYPIEPTTDDYNQHPGITNRRIKNKTEVRDYINQLLPDESKWFNGIHSSDNEIQAVEYLTLAGLDVNEMYDEIIKYKQSFSTTYPVLNVLSQYSKRAKVELINYHGKKAVKKTFKPMCEIFLANEIEAYTLFKGDLPIPELLEVGDNYIITSYIERSKPLGYRIDINTLKKCLTILHQLYDAGYSLLDFKPGNFLIDTKKNLYLIDFEFLYKYKVKPDFINCYDLLGIPEHLDKSIIPNNHILIGTKQFDTLWYSRTHVKYDELLELNRFSTKMKSNYRYFFSKVRKSLFLVNRESRRIAKTIYRHLP